jgi:hypothetical protein
MADMASLCQRAFMSGVGDGRDILSFLLENMRRSPQFPPLPIRFRPLRYRNPRWLAALRTKASISQNGAYG